jgi:uncharacterized membrane protein
MITFHFTFDLKAWGSPVVKDWALGLPQLWWEQAPNAIGSSFLALAGASIWLRTQKKPKAAGGKPLWLSPVARVAAAAALVSLGTAVAYPAEPIWFGVLHCIALASLLLLPLRGLRPAAGLAFTAAWLAFGAWAIAKDAGGSPWLHWLLPRTETPVGDHYPLAPWGGVLWLGYFLAAWLRGAEGWLARFEGRGPPALSWLGRHSLAIYLLHQPVMIGLLWAAGVIRPG